MRALEIISAVINGLLVDVGKIGIIIAVIISFRAMNTLPWVVVDGLLGWIYVAYYFFHLHGAR